MDKEINNSLSLEFRVTLKESDTRPGQWEFVHPDKHRIGNKYHDLYSNETDKLPLPLFPITHNVNKYGVIVTCNGEVKGAFHRYDADCRYGKHFYVGSPYQTLRGDSARLWRDFIKQFGASTGVKIECKLQIFPGKCFVIRLLKDK